MNQKSLLVLTFILISASNGLLNAQFFNVPFTILDSATIKATYTLNWKEDTNNLKQERSENMILLVGEDNINDYEKTQSV